MAAKIPLGSLIEVALRQQQFMGGQHLLTGHEDVQVREGASPQVAVGQPGQDGSLEGNGGDALAFQYSQQSQQFPHQALVADGNEPRQLLQATTGEFGHLLLAAGTQGPVQLHRDLVPQGQFQH